MAEIDFNQKIFVINWEDETIKEITLGELAAEMVETTTSPLGVLPKYHIRINDKFHFYTYDITEDSKIAVWSWGYNGNFPKEIEEFNSIEDAEHKLLEMALYDLERSDITYCYTWKEAENLIS